MTDPTVGSFDLLAASIRADTSDLRTYLDVVAAKLTDALPGSVRVEREGGLFTRDHRVRRVTLRLAEVSYQLEWTGQGLAARVGPNQVSLDDWAENLGEQLSRRARTDARSRTAMDSLVAGRLPAQVLTRPSGAGILGRHPAPRFSPDSTIEVGVGDSAVLVAGSEVLDALGPGSHRVGDAVPASAVQDQATGEIEGALFFASTAERPNQRFGGAIDKVLDPQTQLAVGLRVFGEYVMRVSDPASLVRSLGSQPDVSDERITDVLRDVVLKVLRADLATHISAQGWPVLGLAAHMGELEAAALERLREPAGAFGLAVVRFGNFTVTMKEEDEALVTQYHARQAAAPSAPAPTTAPAGTVTCASCGAANPAGARFCSNCGKPLALRCASCGTENAAGSRFCSQCGSPLTGSAT
jgi:membrane protease subunit (stomatin/prohibitin family)